MATSDNGRGNDRERYRLVRYTGRTGHAIIQREKDGRVAELPLSHFRDVGNGNLEPTSAKKAIVLNMHSGWQRGE